MWKMVEEMRWLWQVAVARTAGGGVLSIGGVHVIWVGWVEGE